jgi:hypothetical protein
MRKTDTAQAENARMLRVLNPVKKGFVPTASAGIRPVTGCTVINRRLSIVRTPTPCAFLHLAATAMQTTAWVNAFTQQKTSNAKTAAMPAVVLKTHAKA